MATALVLDALFGIGIERRNLAVLCRRTENEFVGVESGLRPNREDAEGEVRQEQGAGEEEDHRPITLRLSRPAWSGSAFLTSSAGRGGWVAASGGA